ncbi:MAG: nucleotide exchange factor GrpE [Bacteroidales bacterium]|nr:nucleotide exchange factor GrpE [Bacteroidales bacterium]
MSNDKDNLKAEDLEQEVIADPETVEEVNEEVAEAQAEEQTLEQKVAELEEQVAKEKKEYLFLMAEFDNFRKRTLKEKSELIKNAAEQSLKGMLPIIDDFERGLKAGDDATDVQSVKEGMELIYNKFKKYLEQNGVKEIDPEDRDFDTEKHEAISVVPVPDEAQKGKILDTVQKGYTINGKVMRHAKVVVGQ